MTTSNNPSVPSSGVPLVPPSVIPDQPITITATQRSNTPVERRNRVPGTVIASSQIPMISEAAKAALDKARVAKGNLTRTAPGGSGGTGQTRNASVQVVRAAPKVFSPLYENSNLQLPRDLRTLNSWSRHFFNTNPIVRNAINLHATYPISKFNLECEDVKIKHFFEDMFDQVGMTNLLHAISLEYFKLGEVFPHLELDPNSGIWMHGFCFTENIVITLANGGTKKIKSIELGDRVITHLGNIEKVTEVFVREIEQDIVEFQYVGDNRTLEVTPNHEFYSLLSSEVRCTRYKEDDPKALICLPYKRTQCFVKKKMVNGDIHTYECQKPRTDLIPKWRPIQELQVGDYVATPIIKTVIENPEYSEEMCKLLGYFLAEGCSIFTKDNTQVRFSTFAYNTQERDLIDETKRLIRNLFNYEAKELCHSSNPNCTCVQVYNQEIATFLESKIGRYAHNKCLPEEMLYLPLPLQKVCVEAIINGDGHVQPNGVIVLTLVSPIAINQILLILARLGIEASYGVYPPSKTSSYDRHTLTIKPSQATSLNLMSSKITKFVQAKTHTYGLTGFTRKHVIGSHIFSRIDKKIEKPFKGKVYNFATECDHSYIANGIAAHNCHNNDYIRVQISPLAKDPVLTLIPDEHLKRIVQSAASADVELRRQLPPEIIALIQRGLDIPLSPFNCTHLKMLSSDYDVRGSSLISACFKDLMLYEKLREAEFVQADDMVNPLTHIKLGDPNGCYSEDTEILTENGFKKYNEVRVGEKLATFNQELETIEYQDYTDPVVYYYDSIERGEMYNFKTKTLDILVTPNHNMFTSRWIYDTKNTTYQALDKQNKKQYTKNRYTPWELVKAEDVGSNARFRTVLDWKTKDQEFINFEDKKIPTVLFAKFIGYFISEGWAYLGKSNRSYIAIGQHEMKNDFCDDIQQVWQEIANILGVTLTKYDSHQNTISPLIEEAGHTVTPGIIYRWIMHHKSFCEFLINNFGKGAKNKFLPKWFKNLPKPALSSFLTTAINGDGSRSTPTSFAYYTSSLALANDIQEVAMKAGYVTQYGIHSVRKTPVIYGHGLEIGTKNQNMGRFPLVYSRKSDPIQKIAYKGYVWCFSVPNRILITRRNGMIAVQGNSWKPDDTDIADMRHAFEEAMYDLDFKLITHGGVAIEKIGNGGAVLDTSRMWEMINKNILIGLMTPEEIINGNGASYASATVGLEVLRSRYERFRNTIEVWMKRKVMEPIAKIQDFYKWEHGRRRLVIPKVIWNRMNLRDVESYLQNIIGLVGDAPGQGKVSIRTILNLLDIDPEAQNVDLRKDMIDAAMRAKEQASLAKMSLEELRSLDPNKPIIDKHPDGIGADAGGGVPGEQDSGGLDLGGMGGMGGGGGGGLDLGSLGGPPGGGGEGGLDLGGGGPPSDGGAPTPDLGGPNG